MLRTMMKSKIHRATVTQADLHYVGSVTVDEDLLDAADLLEGELVHIVDVTNGARLETYTIAGPRGSGIIGINGAAARLVHPGDLVILIAYGQMETAEARTFQPPSSSSTPTTRSSAPAATPPRRRSAADCSAATRSTSLTGWCLSGLLAPRTRLDDVRRRGRGRVRHRRADGRAAHPRAGIGSVMVVTKDVLSAGLHPVGAGRHRRRARRRATPPSSISQDTLVAGAGVCDEAAVRVLVTEGPEAVRELIALGTNFDHTPAGELSLTREGGHHRDRIVHAGGDATGAEIQRALVAAVQAAPEIDVTEHALVLDLIPGDRRRRSPADPARDGRGPAATASVPSLPRRRARERRPRPDLRGHHQPVGLHRRRHGARVAGRCGAARPGVRAVPPDRAVARRRLARSAAADLRGGARRGRLPRRRRRRPLHAGPARAGRPCSARRGGQGDHAADARERQAAHVARRPRTSAPSSGSGASRPSWRSAARTASTRSPS